MWHAGGKEELGNLGDERRRKIPLDFFFTIIAEGAVRTEAGSLFAYFATLTEKGDPLLR